MLIEMTSSAFKENGKNRPPIHFKEGLNVVLGKEDGENSIGKSSAMLAIDFVFGGNTYLKSDVIKHIGAHIIYFAFKFNGTVYRFARDTSSPTDILVCSDGYQPTGSIWQLSRFTSWLKENYHMDFHELSFRETVSRFFRIYGKDNRDERNPLRGHTGESMKRSIGVLIKLFNKYKEVEPYKGRLEEQDNILSTYHEARKYSFVPNLVGGKKKYEENVTLIRNLEIELDDLTNLQVNSQDVDIEKSRIKNQLQANKLRLEIDMQAKQRKLTLLNMSLEYGLYPTEADLSALQDFFPGVNIRKLYEVEKYHQKLAAILDEQFSTERQSLELEIASLKKQIADLQAQIKEIGVVGNLSKEFLDKHSEIKGRIDTLKKQNEAYLTLIDLQEARKMAADMYKRATERILSDIEHSINEKMKEFNDSLFPDLRKAPYLHFNEYDSYHFETPDDTGTGTNFKGMVIYDLSVLNLTALPAIAHDSIILKNISDVAIDGIMKIYSQSQKQIFIAFDKQAAYLPDTQKILKDNTVLKLSDNGFELYGESWGKEKKNPQAMEIQGSLF